MPFRAVLAPLVDRLGALWSLLCAAHCAVLPLVLALTPALAGSWWWNERVEQVSVSLVSLVALGSLGLGFLRHRGLSALVLLFPGLVLMWLALLLPDVHESVSSHALAMAAGGMLVGLAHLANLRLGRGHVHGEGCASCQDAC